jgi:hypothetical protein
MLLLAALCSCSGEKAENADKKVTGSFAEYADTFNEWDSAVLRNSFVRLDVIPELGGKIMGYSAFGNQILWHNPTLRGEIDIFHQNDFGEPFINTGGAKVWPAPQGKWGGPPDKVLDGSPYEFTTEGNVITVTGPEDTESGRTGIQYSHRYTLQPKSTIVDLELTMKNSSASPIEWALWHLSTVPANGNYTVYVPVDKGNWEVMHGEKNDEQWLGVTDGFFRARPNEFVGKVGMKVREGWAALHNEDAGIIYTMHYPLEKPGSGKKYPHGGHNFEIWSTGALKDESGTVAPDMSHLELEVLAPLTELAPNESTSLNVKWGVCKASALKRVLPFAVISEEITLKNGSATGKLGTLQSATLEQELLLANGERRGIKKLAEVNPMSEVILNVVPVIPRDAAILRYQLIDANGDIIGILKEIKIKPEDISF